MALAALCADFAFEGKPVRLIRNGQLWFVLADVCEALELTQPTRVAERLDKDEVNSTHVTDSSGRDQGMLIVSEPGLYKLIMTSRKPVAKRFDRWVRHEVLPSIRKTGSYIGPQIAEPFETLRDLFGPVRQQITETYDNVVSIKDALERVDNKVHDLAPKRRDFSKETQSAFIRCIKRHYFGSCPTRCGKAILDDGEPMQHFYTLDHFNGRDKNALTDGWPVCRQCNSDLRDPIFRASKQKQFDTFQETLDRMLRPRTITLNAPEPEHRPWKQLDFLYWL